MNALQRGLGFGPMTFEQTITFLGVKSLSQTAAFYEQVLGLELVRDQGVCRIYRSSPGAFIGFCEHLSSSEVDEGVIITLVSEDVDEWHRILSRQGVSIEKEPQHNPKFGIYHCFLRDPDGYLIEIQRFDDPLT
jgi:catechol 2,3-dioxygenase-like lactoylglutathione lyase family enzyme